MTCVNVVLDRVKELNGISKAVQDTALKVELSASCSSSDVSF